MIFIHFPAQVPQEMALEHGYGREHGAKLLRELRICPCGEDGDGGLDESGNDNFLHDESS